MAGAGSLESAINPKVIEPARALLRSIAFGASALTGLLQAA